MRRDVYDKSLHGSKLQSLIRTHDQLMMGPAPLRYPFAVVHLHAVVAAIAGVLLTGRVGGGDLNEIGQISTPS